jgi:predicted metalloprotease
MNNRYKYDNRRRNYGSQSSTTNGASSIVTLVFITIVLIFWIVSLKSDISQISDEKQMLKSENTELVHKVDSISKILEESRKIVPIVEIIPKKVFRRPIKDTVKVKPVIIQEVKPIVVDSSRL